MTFLKTDQKLLDALDFEADKTCELAACQKTAAWMLICNLCADTTLLCAGHRSKVYQEPHLHRKCTACNQLGRFDVIVRIVPYHG